MALEAFRFVSLLKKGSGWIIAAGLFAVPAPVLAMDHPAAAEFNEREAYQYSQAAIGRTVADHVFLDSRGEEVRFSDFRGKPLVVSMIYSACPHICPLITDTLADARDVAIEALGDDSFSMVSIGFDTLNDTPERMRLYAQQNGVDGLSDWKFLSGDAATIDRLAKDLGFIYYRSGVGFNHLTQTTVIDAEGVVYRQVYGETFELPLLIEALKQQVFKTDDPFASIENLVKKVRLFCTVYDPTTNRYRFDNEIFIKMAAGIIVIGLMLNFVIRNSLRLRRLRKNAEKSLT
ncbi:MAG: SCO family protein [Rhodospirillales bacterium]